MSSQENQILQILKECYWSFSKSYRRILDYLVYMFREFGKVFPSQARIAAHAGCTDRQVRNALNRFQQLGIITWIKNGCRSNTYILDDLFLTLDLKKLHEYKVESQENFRTNFRLVNGILKEDKYITTPPTADRPKSLEKGRVKKCSGYEELPHSLKHPFMKFFDYANYGWQIKLLPEVAQQQIIQDLLWYCEERRRKGSPIRDMTEWCRLFVWKAKTWIFKNSSMPTMHKEARA